MRCVVALVCVLAVTAPVWAERSEDELIAVIVAQPRAPDAEFFANELLERLNRQGRIQELVAWVDRMLAMPQLLYGREDLAGNLHQIQLQAQLLAAMQLHQRASQTKATDDWRAAARSYLSAAALLGAVDVNQSHDRARDALVDAAVCWGAAGDPIAAFEAYATIVDPLIVARVRTATLGIGIDAPLRWLERLGAMFTD